MENQINQQFREDEIANIRRWDKERNEYTYSPFPKIAGRLRLAHEANETLSIETEIIRYDEKVAVVVAVSKTSKGSFKGIGMASIERDQKLAHAILELAETRSIARSLRFAGYGIEYTSAEEMPITENGNGGNGGNGHPNDNLPAKGNRNGDNLPTNGNRNGGSGSNNPGNGNGNGNGSNDPSVSDDNGSGRLSAKQFRYLQKLNAGIGRGNGDLDKQCLAMFGTVAQFLSKGDASTLIEHLLAQ
jgi:hypothetical protein